MQPYRREKAADFEQWIDWVENHIDDVWKHSIYKHMNAFFQQHREQYMLLRKADLARYPSAPDTLASYERVPDFYVPYENRDFPPRRSAPACTGREIGRASCRERV